MTRYNIVFLSLFTFLSPAWARTIEGRLVGPLATNRADEPLLYQCTAYSEGKLLTVQILVRTRDAYLDVTLPEGVRVRGMASETLDPTKGATYYFLQGGSAPLFQRLTLELRESGKWAQFTRATGADAFVCSL